MATDPDRAEKLAQLAAHRDLLERLAALDVPASEDAQRALELVRAGRAAAAAATDEQESADEQ